ncbi:unnamed protein product [Lepidochelys kempii]
MDTTQIKCQCYSLSRSDSSGVEGSQCSHLSCFTSNSGQDLEDSYWNQELEMEQEIFLNNRQTATDCILHTMSADLVHKISDPKSTDFFSEEIYFVVQARYLRLVLPMCFDPE